jgi:putative colanic acid biosynthesis UDP-glucose lipid carrier transferase
LILKSYRKKGGNLINIVIIGAGEVAEQVYEEMKADVFSGFKVLGFFDNNVKSSEIIPDYLGTLQDLPAFCNSKRIDEIYYTLPITTGQHFMPLVRFARMNIINFFVVPDFNRVLKRKIDLLFLDNIALFKFSTEPLSIKSNRIVKRVLDIVFSVLVIIFTYPLLFLILVPLIKLSSPGPILFKQERTGLKGENFVCYKFRSMAVNKDADNLQATRGDARITRLGSFLRKTNLDEMPQFINVIKGDMSVVGPRPHMIKHTEEYSRLIDRYMFRHLVKPGVTGWAQVTGFRGETKDLKQMEGRVEKDVWYIENWSILLDIKIILNTVINAVIGDDNAF